MRFEHIKENGALNYLLRSTQQHHVRLSAMADQKANIMIAATSILLTFAFANFKQQNLFWGFLALFVFSFIALLLAVLAVSPRFTPDPQARSYNPLFFGDFGSKTLDQYFEEMEEVMSSDQRAYEAQVRDIYNLGVTLQNHKYKYLSMSYRVFLLGIVVTASLFVLQTALFYLT